MGERMNQKFSEELFLTNQTGSYLNNIGKVTLKPNSLLGTPSLIKASETTNVTPNACRGEKIS